MKRNVAVIVALVVGSAGCEFPGPRQGLDLSPPPPCAVEREQALLKLPAGCLGFFLDEATGGPLHCIPGFGDECTAINASCVSDPIVVDVAVQTTLAVEFRQECEGAPVSIQSIALVPAQEGVVVLEPQPGSFNESSFLFIGVGPFAETGRREQRIDVTAEARNLSQNGFDIATAALTLVIDAEGP